MKINLVSEFLYNSGYEKLYLTALPALLSVVLASNIFSFNIINSLIIIIGILSLHLSVNIFDDFSDWTSGETSKRLELEKIGIRGRFDKCKHFYTKQKSPRKYFYYSAILLLIFVFCLSCIAFLQHSYKIFGFLAFIPIFWGLTYWEKCNYLVKKIGYEPFISFLCSFGNISIVFYASTKYLSLEAITISFIMFFFIMNISYTASLLNIKTDKMTNKNTFATTIENQYFRLFFVVFFNIFPYCLTYFLIETGVLPKLSYLTFILIPQSCYLIYLTYIYEKSPQKIIKWNIFIGPDKNKIKNEQNNLSWYTLRYNLARNIFCTYTIFLIISIVI